MAANKEAIVIVLDVGPSMNQAPPGESTALQTSLDAINMILQRKMFSESKDEIALVLCGTPDTDNALADGESYENITVAKPLNPVSWELLEFVQNNVQPSTESADFLDAMVVAMDHCMKSIQGKRGFGSKRIILFSDVGGEFGDDNLDDIVASMKEADIELNVIGPDLDDDDDDGDDSARPSTSNGHVKARTAQQRAGEKLLKYMIDRVEGGSYSFSEALPALSYFQTRAVRPTAWKCQLELGDNLQIPINMFKKVTTAKAKTNKNVYAKDPDAGIERIRTFHLNDEEESEIEQSDTVEGHRYGSTLVPFSEDDKDAMKYRAEKCFQVLGFTDSSRVKRHLFMGDGVSVCVAEKFDEAASVALSALIHALYELNRVMIVRRNYSNASAPKLGCLAPHIKANYECLFYTELPYNEDLRLFTFGSLPISEEKTAANQKLAPTDAQLSAMDDLITSMDLSKAAEDDDDDDGGTEALKPKHIFNPHLQRLYQCLQHRALSPDEPLPELSPIIAQSLKPPAAVEVRCEPVLKRMRGLFTLKVIERKKDDKTGDALFKDDAAGDGPAAKKPKVEGDAAGVGGAGMADLVKARITEVGTVTPVDDFRAIIGRKDEDKFDQACRMMQKRVIQIVMDSFGAQFYGKAMECLKVLRQECVKNSEPKSFNDFLVDFKKSLAEKGRKDFWKLCCTDKVSLITKTECEESHVTVAESAEFIAESEPKKAEAEPEEEGVDAEDLLDEM